MKTQPNIQGTPDDPRGFLMRFEDGPLAGQGNLRSIAGTVDTLNVDSAVWSWPLPTRLGVLAHLALTENIALWDADGDGDGLPEAIWRSRNAVVYRKVGESQMPRGTDRVVRGAVYRLEERDVEDTPPNPSPPYGVGGPEAS